MPITIVSVYPQLCKAELPFCTERKGGVHKYVLPAAPSEGFSSLVVDDAYQSEYLGENVGTRIISVPSLGISRNLIEIWAVHVVGTQSGSGPGIMALPEGQTIPTEEQLEKLRDNQIAYFDYLFHQAEDLYTKGDGSLIDATMRGAAKWLGRLSVPWMKPATKTELKKCPFCISDIPFQAVVCSVCRRDLVDAPSAPPVPKRAHAALAQKE